MEVISWNKEQIAINVPNAVEVFDVIRGIEAAAEQRGLYISDVQVNGLSFSEEDEARFARLPLNEINEVRVVARTVPEMVAGSIKGLVELANVINDRCAQVADSLSSGITISSQTDFLGFVDEIRLMLDTIEALRPHMSSVPPRELEIATRDIMNQIATYFLQKDVIAVADVLRYRLSDLITKWVQFIRSIHPN